MPNLKRVIVLVEHRLGYFRDVLRGVRTYARQGHPWVLHSTDSAAEGLGHLLSELPRPIGLFAVNDTWASAISERCHECGTSIPNQVALIGVDNDDLVCESANPPISSVQTAGQRIGYEAARLLDALMEGRDRRTPS